MSSALIKSGYLQAKKLLFVQLIIILVVSGIGLLKEFQAAIALLSGGVAVWLANIYFVFKAFSKSGAQANKQIVSAFYFGETVKIVLAVVLLIVAFVLNSGFEVFVLTGYIAALLTQWLAPVIIKTY